MQRMVAGGLAAGGQCPGGSVARWSELLHRTMRWRRPGPQLGVHCNWTGRCRLSGCPGPARAQGVAGMLVRWEARRGAADLGPVEGGPLGRAGGAVAGFQDRRARLPARAVVQRLLLGGRHATLAHDRAATHARVTAAAAARPVPHHPAVGRGRQSEGMRGGAYSGRGRGLLPPSNRRDFGNWHLQAPAP